METIGHTMKQLVAALLALSLTTLAMAADPPARVGRVTLIQGTVKFYADQEEGWQPAQLNLPVTSENSIWTEGRSRAEWRVGPAAVRLDHDTVLDIQKLDDSEVALYVQRGAANIRVGLIEKGEVFRIFTPEGTVTLRARGSYRIEADMEKGESRIAVLSGRARVESTAGSPWIEAGRMALLERDSARVESLARTDFDDWVLARDEKWDVAAPADVSPYMTGYEELNSYGTWETETEYGRVWVPRVVVDWAPYRYGHWRYVRPWGWTWIDDAPWGFAPMHYGRWVHARGRWAWWPGDRSHRPVWSPALVAWVGGSGWSVSYSSGVGPGVGWFPLAPYEAYVPWYRHSPSYVHNINRIHGNRPVPSRPPRQYANHKPGVTIVSPATFQGALPVANHRARMSGEAIWNQPVVQEGVNLPPRRGAQGAGQNPGAPGGKPAVMQSGVPAQPMPLPQRTETQRPQKPQPGFAANQGGPKPATLDSNTPSMPAESMPSRPAPSTTPTPNFTPRTEPTGTPSPQAPVQRSEPQPRYTPKPRAPVESSQSRPEAAPAPSTRDTTRDRTREVTREPNPSQRDTNRDATPRTQRPERVERTERIERPRAVESSQSRPAPAPAPSVQPAPTSPVPRSTPQPQPAPKPAPAPREARERDDGPQPERIKNPGRTQER
jgi:hypothetical protein